MEYSFEKHKIIGAIEADDQYWRSLEEGEFKLPRCASCRHWTWPAHFRCGRCGAWEFEWVAVETKGTIFTWTRTHYAFDRVLERKPQMSLTSPSSRRSPAPDGARVMGILKGDDRDLRTGMPVRGSIEPPERPQQMVPLDPLGSGPLRAVSPTATSTGALAVMKFRGSAAVVGIAQTPYYKRGTSPEPELKLALRAITAAAEDAGIDVRDINGFVSYASERSDPAKLMPALGTREVKFASLVWFHGGGLPATLNIAACAILSGQAEVVADLPLHGRAQQPAASRDRGAERHILAIPRQWPGFARTDPRIARATHDAASRRAPVGAVCDRGRLLLPCQEQLSGIWPQHRHERRGLCARAHDLRALSVVRLLPRERRGGVRAGGLRRARQGFEAEAGLHSLGTHGDDGGRRGARGELAPLLRHRRPEGTGASGCGRNRAMARKMSTSPKST